MDEPVEVTSEGGAPPRAAGSSALVITAVVVVAVLLVALVTAVMLSSNDTDTTTTAAPGPVMTKYHCDTCHGVTADPPGGQELGPTWAGLYGSTVTLDDGRTVVADDAYLTKAIEDPKSELVEGYGPTMPDDNVTPDDVAALIAEIKALQDQG